MLVCFACRNTENFVQVSERADSRELAQSHAHGLRAHAWTRPDDRAQGLYCARCQEALDILPGEVGLTDERVQFLAPDKFTAEYLVTEFQSLRTDATWNRLDLPARSARWTSIPSGLHPAVLAALKRTGRSRLYSHQASAIEQTLAGSNVLQATSAGSGKSFGFLIPVLNRLLTEPSSTAILIFPLRALANDQLEAIIRLGVNSDPWCDTSSIDLILDEIEVPIRVGRYDGATPDHERADIRRFGRLLITTPDMLHASIVRHANTTYRDGTSWGRLFRGLTFVVLDELHTYQGVFGSNVAHVLRRLRRTAARYGSSPQFLGASATIGNPVELAERLTGLSGFQLVDDDGSAREQRIVLLCNPPERSQESASAQATKKGDAARDEGGRIAPQTVAIELAAQSALGSVDHLPVRTIVFCRSRNQVFQLAQRVRNALKELRRADLADTVASYAATFLTEDRVDAEGRIRDGSTLAVVSTNALELGIDIPELSLALLVGYPGQISSFRQRIGRVGRLGQGLAVLIVGDDPMQQFLARNPETLNTLLHSQAENVVVNPEAPEIARRFGLIPAQEEFGGVAYEDEAFFGPIVHEWLAQTTGPPATVIDDVAYWKIETEPITEVGIRDATGGASYTVLHQDRRELTPIGVLDAASAPRDAFVPAIWSTSNGDLYRVVGFDQRAKEIYCEGPLDVGYQTRGVPVDRVEILGRHSESVIRGNTIVGYGHLTIARQVFSYREIHFSGIEHGRQVERGWPPLEFETDGLFLQLGSSSRQDTDTEASIRAAEHLLLSAAPAVVACDPYDIDATSDRMAIYLYDSFGGGIKLTEPVFSRFDEVLALAIEIVATCPCNDGCPACIMLTRRPEGNRDLSKHGALHLLQALQHPTERLPRP